MSSSFGVRTSPGMGITAGAPPRHLGRRQTPHADRPQQSEGRRTLVRRPSPHPGPEPCRRECGSPSRRALRWSATIATMNRLSSSTSPYLLQHKDNPVDWWEWSDAAFAEARRRDVPILLSVGYAACHWCHVMAHESFENEQIAAVLNEHFVSIK